MAFCPVKRLKSCDFPTFGNPTRTHCISAFFIPCWDDFPAFFLFVMFCFSFLSRVVRLRSMFSADLCFGHSFIIISRQGIRSSSVVASRNSFSALW